MFAEKCDISEELTRLASHFGQFQRYYDSVEPMGRALDGLGQEGNRDLNTIGSKSKDLEVADTIVGLKAELEQIREQVQNIE